MNVARWVRRTAFTGAAAIGVVAAVASFAPAKSSAASRPNVFNIASSAWGVRVEPDTHPEPFPVQDAFNESFPYATSSVQAGGVSEADAQVFYAGAEQTPALICVLAGGPKGGQPYCSQVPVPAQLGGFPPPYPFEAHASYPVAPKADAPVSGHQIGSQGAMNSMTAAPTYAIANADNATGVSAATNGTFLPGTPLALSAGSVSATTDQHFSGTTAVTRSIASAHNVTIGGVIHIASVTSVSEVDNDGIHKPVNRSSVTIAGASAGGLAASIDNNGLHLSSNNVAKTVFAQISNTVNQRLTQLGISVRAVGTTATSVDTHTLSVEGAGLQVNFARSFSEICSVSSAICNFQPSIPMCTNPPPINQQPLIDPCNPPFPSPRDTYVMSADIAFSSASNGASFYTYVPPPLGVGGIGGVAPPTGAGPTTTFVPGTPGTSGTSGSPGNVGPSVAGGSGSNGSNAGGLTGYLENFAGVSGRLKFLFPLLGFVIIGVLAGRVGRTPARLPRPLD
jgi:hypothetical protein